MHDLNYCMPDLNYCMPDLNYCGITAELLSNRLNYCMPEKIHRAVAPGLHETNFNTQCSQCYNDAIGLTSRWKVRFRQHFFLNKV